MLQILNLVEMFLIAYSLLTFSATQKACQQWHPTDFSAYLSSEEPKTLKKVDENKVN